MVKHWLLLGCTALLLAACAATRLSAPSDQAQQRVGWPPLSPGSLGKTQTASQVLRIAFAERENTLNCVVTVKPEQLVIVGVTALGMRAFTVKYDGKQISAEAQAGVPQAMQPERLLNDVQLVYWPLPALQKALAHTAWELTEPAPGTRRLRRDGRLIAEVHYASADPWQGRVWLVNLEFGYTLNIESHAVVSEL